MFFSERLWLRIPWHATCVRHKKQLVSRRDEDENQHKGFPCAAGRKGRTQRVADDGEAILQVGETVSQTPGRTRGGVELPAAPLLRVQALCDAADFSGDGRRII